MCGRYALITPIEDLAEHFDAEGPPDVEFEPRYNIAPTQESWVVRSSEDQLSLDRLAWGLVPAWAPDSADASRRINARIETLVEKPSFASSLPKQRCLVPATGFFEWRLDSSGKQPYFFSRTDGEPLAFAGLWARWKGADGAARESFTIVTTEARGIAEEYHARMPVVLESGDRAAWLTGSEEEALACCRASREPDFEVYPVDPWVNHARHDGPRCLEAFRPVEQGLLF